MEKWQPLLIKKFVRVYEFLLHVAYYSYYITKYLKFETLQIPCSSFIFSLRFLLYTVCVNSYFGIIGAVVMVPINGNSCDLARWH